MYSGQQISAYDRRAPVGSYARNPYAQLRDAEKLEQAIKAVAPSIPAFAVLVDVTTSMIYQLVQGGRDTCTPDLAERIATAAKVPVDDLFEVTTAIRRRRRRHPKTTEVSPT